MLWDRCMDAGKEKVGAAEDTTGSRLGMRH